MALPQVGLEAVIENLAGFSKGATQITKAYDQIDTGASKVEKSSAGLSGVFSSVGSGLLSVGKVAAGVALGGVTLLGGGLVALGTKSVLAAADVGEMQSLFNTAFGQDAPKARAEIDEFAAAVGRNKFELEGFAGGIKSLVTPMGVTAEAGNEMSIGFSKLAVDLSSFFNVTESDALDSLRSGLIGETEPLRKFGIVLNEAAIKQKALNMGIFDGKGNMDAATKASATYALIMEQTKMAQGDAARTSGSWVNQTRALKSAIDEATVEIGMQLIPVLTPLLQQFTAMVKQYLPQLVEWFKVNLPIAIQTATDFWNNQLYPAIQAAQAIFKGFSKSGSTINKTFSSIYKSAKPIIDKIMPELIDIFNIVYKWVIKNWPLIQKVITTVMAVIQAEIKAATKVILYVWKNWGDEITKAVTLIFKIIKVNLENALDFVTLVMQLITGDWSGAWETIKDIADRSLGLILDLVKASFNNMLKAISDIMGNIKNKISDIWSSIVNTIKDKVNEAYNAVKSKFDTLASLISGYASSLLAAAKTMMQGIINGINSMLSSITSALNSVMTSAINSLRNAITSGSLYSILISAGQAIINTIKAGIALVTDLASRLISLVQSAINQLASSISSGVLYNILINAGRNIINYIGSGINAVTTLAGTLIAKVQAAINSLSASSVFDALYGIGEDIVNGIIDGVRSMGTELGGALQDIVDDAIQAIKDQLGIGSPSKVFFAVGLDMMKGLQAGISALAPTINTQLQSAIAGPAVNAPALGATGNTSIFNTFQLGGNTINSGMDQAQFEARVMRAIRRNL